MSRVSPAGKEAVKGVIATTVVSAAGDPTAVIAQAIASSLNVAVECFGDLSKKRTDELFNSPELLDDVLSKIRESDDFASFVFDIWQKHNFESSTKRRRMLKVILEHEAINKSNEFENFSRLEFLVQNLSVETLKMLRFFNTTVYAAKIKRDDGTIVTRPNLRQIQEIANEHGYGIHEQDLEYRMNELTSNGLASVTHGVWDGPMYNQTKFGFLLIEYISEALDD